MFRPALIIFVSFELLYYLLIAQTGIVEYFNSNIFTIIYLPIGGIIGSIICGFTNIKFKSKIIAFISLQIFATLFYPQLNPLTLFVMGIAVGGMAPIVVKVLSRSNKIELALSLIIAYVCGTFLFSVEPADRFPIAIILSISILFTSLSINVIDPLKVEQKSNKNFSIIFTMLLWVILDSTLFETLSRDIDIPIWRSGFSIEIALFHILGVILALVLKHDDSQKEFNIIILFALSYLFYFLREAYLLSIVYPIVISYYNVVILMKLRDEMNFKLLSIYMIFIGWIASGVGLFIALEQYIIFVPLLFIFMLLNYFNKEQNYTKEIHYV